MVKVILLIFIISLIGCKHSVFNNKKDVSNLIKIGCLDTLITLRNQGRIQTIPEDLNICQESINNTLKILNND